MTMATRVSTVASVGAAASPEWAALEAIGRVMAGGLAVLDGQRRVDWLNAAAADLLGVPVGELLPRARTPWT